MIKYKQPKKQENYNNYDYQSHILLDSCIISQKTKLV